MSSQLIKQLKREVAASPGKAGLLGLLSLVALYFLVPLIWKHLPMGKRSSGAPSPPAAVSTVAATSNSPAAIVAAAGSGANQTARHGWKDLVAAMAGDELMRPARFSADVRDPFQNVAREREEETPVAETQPVKPDLTPQELGLVLNSTIVGPTRSVAMISGKSYRYSQRDQQPPRIVVRQEEVEYVFQLIDVRPRKVILAREGQEYALKLKVPALANQGLIQVEGNSGSP